MASSTLPITRTTTDVPYALSRTVNWDEIRAELNAGALSSPLPSPSTDTRGSTSSQMHSTASVSSIVNPCSVNTWISGSTLATYLSAKETMHISSVPWRGWVPVSAMFDRVSADPKQTFNELVQKGLVTGHVFSESHDMRRGRWFITLDVEDARLDDEYRSFKGEHRSKSGARTNAIKALIVAIIRQHAGLDLERIERETL